MVIWESAQCMQISGAYINNLQSLSKQKYAQNPVRQDDNKRGKSVSLVGITKSSNWARNGNGYDEKDKHASAENMASCH